MEKPYRIPVKSGSFDIVLSGQVFEHVPLFWASLLEIARVMKPEGYFFLTVPSRGHVHAKYAEARPHVARMCSGSLTRSARSSPARPVRPVRRTASGFDPG